MIATTKDNIKKEYDMINDNLQSITDLVIVSEIITQDQAGTILFKLESLDRKIREIYSNNIKELKSEKLPEKDFKK